jgi:hypothetical protein
MSRAIYRSLSLAAFVFALVGVSACGSSRNGGGPRGSANNVVAIVGGTPITQSSLDHWAATFVRGDYYSTMQRRAPAGLATDPPNYAMCVSGERAVIEQAAEQPAPRRSKPRTKPTAAQLAVKCHQLYRDVRREALGYLISVLWVTGEAAERGHKVTEGAINERITELQQETYPKPGQFASYLANKGWSRTDLRYIVRRNLLSGYVLQEVKSQVGNGSGSELALARRVRANVQKWTTKTTCRGGIVVEACKEYRGATSSDPSPAVIFEQLAESS